MTEILLIHEVAARLKVSKSSINRWLGLARRGESTFPLPLSTPGGKCRWTSESIDCWIQSQAAAASPVPSTPRQKRRNAKASQERQASVDRQLDRFRSRGNS